MKNPAPIIGIFTLLFFSSCTKTAEGNSSIIKTDSDLSIDSPKIEATNSATIDTNVTEKTDRYVAEDGSSALVTFTNKDNEKSISIKSNNKIISAPQRSSSANVETYGNYDFEIISKNDSITITQGNNVINLKKARGQ